MISHMYESYDLNVTRVDDRLVEEEAEAKMVNNNIIGFLFPIIAQ